MYLIYFYMILEIIMCFSPHHSANMMYCIDFPMLNHPCTAGINPPGYDV